MTIVWDLSSWNDPSRVYEFNAFSPAPPRTKSPIPLIARSSAPPVCFSDPCECNRLGSSERDPIPVIDAFRCSSILEKTSSKLALLFLNPVEFAFAILLDTTDISLFAVSRPLRIIENINFSTFGIVLYNIYAKYHLLLKFFKICRFDNYFTNKLRNID